MPCETATSQRWVPWLPMGLPRFVGRSRKHAGTDVKTNPGVAEPACRKISGWLLTE